MRMRAKRRRQRIKGGGLAQPLRRGVVGIVAVPVAMVIAGASATPALAQTPTHAQAQTRAHARALAQPPVSPAGNPAKCLPFPANLKLNPRFPLPKPPPGSKAFHQPQPACGYLAGSMNVRKLAASVPIGPGLSDLRLGLTTYTKFTQSYSYFQQDVAGQLNYHGLPEFPPARATFLAFGHIPVVVTIHLSEIGSINLALISCAPTSTCPNNPANDAQFFARATLRISNLEIAGVPVSVGPHCGTATPFNLALTGLPPAYNVSQVHGVLTGMVTIPPFKGCASGGHSLDPILTKYVSGPGNSVKLTQAPICTPTVGVGCPPVRPGTASSPTLSSQTGR